MRLLAATVAALAVLAPVSAHADPPPVIGYAGFGATCGFYMYNDSWTDGVLFSGPAVVPGAGSVTVTCTVRDSNYSPVASASNTVTGSVGVLPPTLIHTNGWQYYACTVWSGTWLTGGTFYDDEGCETGA